MTAATPLTLIDWLSAELDNKLSSLPDDQARYRDLILYGNVWREKYETFAASAPSRSTRRIRSTATMDAYGISPCC
jgi:hypothetical protein